MNFPGCAPQTGGRWLAAMAAQWLVDGSNSARRRRARAWPPQRAVGAKPPGSPERRERQETSSCRPGPGLPRLSGWERIQPFEFFSPGVGGKSLADKHLATCLPTASSERATELSADAVRPAELLPTPSRAVATRRAVTRRAIHSTSSGPVRAVSVVRRCIANLLLLAVVAIVAAPLSAHAATLVSNNGQSSSSIREDLEQRNYAQAFTTGAGEYGYAVESVELNFGTAPTSGTTSVQPLDGGQRDAVHEIGGPFESRQLHGRAKHVHCPDRNEPRQADDLLRSHHREQWAVAGHQLRQRGQ